MDIKGNKESWKLLFRKKRKQKIKKWRIWERGEEEMDREEKKRKN